MYFCLVKDQSAILLELAYLPNVQYFTKLLAYDKVYLEAQEHYSKGSYRNRCHIVAANGLQRFSIPLNKGKHQKMGIRNVEIAYTENWQAQQWQSIQSAYGNAPFFEFYADELAPVFKMKTHLLWDWNWHLLRLMLQLTGIDANIEFTTSYEPTPPAEILDFRNSISPKKQRQKEDARFEPSPYAQVFTERHGFLANLSILDVLFCTGPGAIQVIQNSIR